MGWQMNTVLAWSGEKLGDFIYYLYHDCPEDRLS